MVLVSRLAQKLRAEGPVPVLDCPVFADVALCSSPAIPIAFLGISVHKELCEMWHYSLQYCDPLIVTYWGLLPQSTPVRKQAACVGLVTGVEGEG